MKKAVARRKTRPPRRTTPLLALLLGCTHAPPSPPAVSPSPAWVEPPADPPPSEPTPAMVEPTDDAPRQQPPSEAIGGAGGLLPRFGALGRCTLNGVPKRTAVRVDPASGGAFVVHVHSSTVDVTFGIGEGASSRVTSASALRFEGSARELVLSLKKGVVRHEGMLRAPRGARLVSDRELPNGQIGVLTSIGVPIDVPCDHLAFGAREPPTNAITQHLPIVVPGDDATLLLASSPRAVPSLPLPPGLVFTRLAGGVDFVKISHRGWDGVTLGGYLPAARLLEGGVEGIGGGGMGCGCGLRGFAIHRRAPQDPYEGPAKLREGALIRSERGGGVWARGVGNTPVTVTWKGGSDPWVRIDTIPGVDDTLNNPCNCAGITHAFVLRDGVEF